MRPVLLLGRAFRATTVTPFSAHLPQLVTPGTSLGRINAASSSRSHRFSSRASLHANTAAANAIMNGPNATARSKRKEPPHSHAIDGRQTKHLRANGDASTGDNTPETRDDDYDAAYEDYEDTRLQPLLPGPDTAEWQATIESVVRNVVSIRFCQTCSFDTDPALTSEATGFVVDAERG